MNSTNTQVETLKIIVKGFNDSEQRLLSATVRLSERRNPVLLKIASSHIDAADVVIIDGQDEDALEWAEENKRILARKPVVWVDKKPELPNHNMLQRPVLWVNLPIILSRVLDDASVSALPDSGMSAAEPSQPQSVSPASPTAAQPAGEQLSILVVDDSPAIRTHLGNLLKKGGDKVVTTDAGEKGVELVGQYRFDCVFMDVLMPGMDGYEACRKIKAKKINGKSVPVIMLTGKSSPFDRIRGKMAGCDAYLTKPVAVSKLKKTLKDVVLKSKR